MRARASLGSDAALTCICASAADGCKLTKKTMVKFTWRLVTGDRDKEHIVNVRCDHACARGVPLPETSRVACESATRRARMAQVAKEAEGAVKFDGAVVTCRRAWAHNVLHAHVC